MRYYPAFYRIRQKFSEMRIPDLRLSVKQAVREMALADKIRHGAAVAITAGSRGIANIAEILRLVGEEIRALDGKPFLVAAMGSHGGGTAQGMLEVLESLGITPETVRMPVKASGAVVHLGNTASGIPVYCAEEAYAADGIIVVNRVKAHTAFRGEHESGLYKMLSVGLGRARGAAAVHRLGPAKMAQVVYEVGSAVLNRVPVIGGIGIVENGNEETVVIKGCQPKDFETVDKKLLERAKSLAPSLPVEQIDLLIVEEMGKNYSGTGLDTNVIGRFYLEGVPEPEIPKITRIVVLGLSEASHGNANGVGLADFITKRLFDAIDLEKTYMNGLTTNFLRRIKLPVIMPDDEQAIKKAWESLRLDNPQQARVMIIHNTLHLDELYISEALYEEVAQLDHIIIEDKCTLEFNQGKLAIKKE